MTSRSPFTCVLWDVDGTIVDASDGILRRLTIALEHFGKPAPTRAELVHRSLTRNDEALVHRLRERGALRAADFAERSSTVAPTLPRCCVSSSAAVCRIALACWI